MSTDISWCKWISVDVNRYQSMSTDVSWCQSTSTDMKKQRPNHVPSDQNATIKFDFKQTIYSCAIYFRFETKSQRILGCSSHFLLPKFEFDSSKVNVPNVLWHYKNFTRYTCQVWIMSIYFDQIRFWPQNNSNQTWIWMREIFKFCFV